MARNLVKHLSLPPLNNGDSLTDGRHTDPKRGRVPANLRNGIAQVDDPFGRALSNHESRICATVGQLFSNSSHTPSETRVQRSAIKVSPNENNLALPLFIRFPGAIGLTIKQHVDALEDKTVGLTSKI